MVISLLDASVWTLLRIAHQLSNSTLLCVCDFFRFSPAYEFAYAHWLPMNTYIYIYTIIMDMARLLPMIDDLLASDDDCGGYNPLLLNML